PLSSVSPLRITSPSESLISNLAFGNGLPVATSVLVISKSPTIFLFFISALMISPSSFTSNGNGVSSITYPSGASNSRYVYFPYSNSSKYAIPFSSVSPLRTMLPSSSAISNPAFGNNSPSATSFFVISRSLVIFSFFISALMISPFSFTSNGNGVSSITYPSGASNSRYVYFPYSNSSKYAIPFSSVSPSRITLPSSLAISNFSLVNCLPVATSVLVISKSLVINSFVISAFMIFPFSLISNGYSLSSMTYPSGASYSRYV